MSIVNLEDIIEGMDMQLDESSTFLNKKTGEIVLVSSEDLRLAEDDEPYDDLPNWQQKERKQAIDVVENFENYIELPTAYDIHEYDIIEDFCQSVRDDKTRDRLLRAIRGKGAFRRFKDRIIELDIEDQWYDFRDGRYRQIAIDWCESHNIDFVE